METFFFYGVHRAVTQFLLFGFPKHYSFPSHILFVCLNHILLLLASSSVHLFSLHLDLFELLVCAVVFSCSLSMMLLKRLMGESKMLMFSSTNVSFSEGKYYRHMLLVLIRRHRRIPFAIIAFQMAYGFHFLSFRNDFQRRFPFIFIHLHNSMHLETLMCVLWMYVCVSLNGRRKKMKALYVSRLAYTRNQKLMWVKWLETEKPHD